MSGSCGRGGSIHWAFVTIPLLASFVTGIPESNAADDASQGLEMYRAVYHFRATRGKSVPVCAAFLKRLNSAAFDAPPECGIPDATTVPGFSKLNRVFLSTDEVTALYSHIWGFTSRQDQFYELDKVGKETASLALEGVGRSLSAWRYDPALSINNDGKPTNVLVWQGSGAFGSVEHGICGQVVLQAGSMGPVQPAQVAFVLVKDNKQIDESQTRALFGRKNRNATVIANGQPIETMEFAPLGYYLGFFKYGDVYYMHTFYDSTHGDLEQRRYNEPSMNKALAVFRRTNGHTEQLCEYQMSEKSLVGWTRQ